MQQRDSKQASITVTLVLGLAFTLCLGTGCSERIDTPDEFVQLGRLRERKQDHAGAAEAYAKALKLAPDDATLWYDRGVAQLAAGEPEKAIADYTRAVELDPEFSIAWNNLGAAQSIAGDHEAAFGACTRAIEIDPIDPMPWRNRGLALHKLGLVDEAIEDLTRAVHLDPENAFFHYALGNSLLDADRPADAAREFTLSIELDDSEPDPFLNRAIALSRLNEPTAAAADLAAARERGAVTENITPDNLPTHRQAPLPAVVTENLTTAGYTASNNKWTRNGNPVRIIARPMMDRGVHFTERELRAIADSGMPVVLIVFESAEDGWHVVRRFDDWKPETSSMRPVRFELPIERTEHP